MIDEICVKVKRAISERLRDKKAHSNTRKIEISITIEILRYFVLVQTGGNISLIAERDDFVLTELRMPDIKLEYNPCPCRAENTKIICSSVHTSAAMQIITLISK